MKLNFTGFIILLIIIASLGFATWYFYKKSVVQKQDATLAAAVKNNFTVTPISTFTDKNGSKHNQYNPNQNKFSQAAVNGRGDSTMGGPDTAAQVLKIQKERIEYWQQMSATYEATALRAQKGKDSLGNMVRYYKSKYMDIIYHPPRTADTADNGTFDYKGHFTATGTQYYKSKFLWWRYNPVFDLSIDDPNATINGYRTFTVNQPDQIFNIKAQVKTDYYFSTGHIVPSTGLEIDLGKFNFSGRYYWSYKAQKLQPVLSLSYNFFQLHP